MLNNIEIVKHIANLSVNPRTNSRLELNITRMPGKPEKYDLRRWSIISDNGEKLPGGGVALSIAEFEQLKKALMDE